MLRVVHPHRNTLSNHCCPWWCHQCHHGDCHLRKPWADHRHMMLLDVSLTATTKARTFCPQIPPVWARSLMLSLAVQLTRSGCVPAVLYQQWGALLGKDSFSLGRRACGMGRTEEMELAGAAALGTLLHCPWRAAFFSFAGEFLLSWACKTDRDAQEKKKKKNNLNCNFQRRGKEEVRGNYQESLPCLGGLLSSVHQALCSNGADSSAEAGEPLCWLHLTLPHIPGDKLCRALPICVQPRWAERWGLKSIHQVADGRGVFYGSADVNLLRSSNTTVLKSGLPPVPWPYIPWRVTSFTAWKYIKSRPDWGAAARNCVSSAPNTPELTCSWAASADKAAVGKFSCWKPCSNIHGRAKHMVRLS